MYIKSINWQKNASNIFIKIFIIIIIFFSIYIKIISFIKSICHYFELQTQFLKNEYMFNFSNNHKLKIIKKFKKVINPAISIISPVFNSEKYILRFLKSIQNQNFIDIETILIDDSSFDNSINIINNYKLEDERIVLIKNQKNKGTFIARNIGVLFSKGKYIILPDPDDILTNNILNFCYKFANKYKIEIIRFNIYMGNNIISFNNIIKKIKSRPINQPELSTFHFYGNNELERIDFYITNKFIKRDVFIKSLNILQNLYLNMYIKYMEDSIINFLLYRIAKSLLFLPNLGYYYIKSKESITTNLKYLYHLKIKGVFMNLKTILDFSKNTKYERDISNLRFTELMRTYKFDKFLPILKFNNDFYLYYNIINSFLKSFYFNQENKDIFINIKNIMLDKIKKNKYEKKK